MDLFKRMGNKMATALDWNCPKVCKRHKGDTRRIHKNARTKLSKLDKMIIEEWNNYIDTEK